MRERDYYGYDSRNRWDFDDREEDRYDSRSRPRTRGRQESGWLDRARNEVKDWFRGEDRDERWGGRDSYGYDDYEDRPYARSPWNPERTSSREEDRCYGGRGRQGGMLGYDEGYGRDGYFGRDYGAWGHETSNFHRRSGGFAGRGPKSFRRSDDRIAEDVCRRLSDHDDLDATHIDVDVKGGEVTLRGTVEDRRGKRLAEELAEAIWGVADVHNEIRVQKPGTAPLDESRAA